MKDREKLPREVLREAAKQLGKRGGRPRTVVHVEKGYCRCAECRAGRAEEGRVEKRDVEFQFDY